MPDHDPCKSVTGRHGLPSHLSRCRWRGVEIARSRPSHSTSRPAFSKQTRLEKEGSRPPPQWSPHGPDTIRPCEEQQASKRHNEFGVRWARARVGVGCQRPLRQRSAATRVCGGAATRVSGSEAKKPMAVQLGESFPRRPPRPHAPRTRLPSLAHLPVDSHGRSTASIDNLDMNATGLGDGGGTFPRTPPSRLPSAFPTSESSLAYCLAPLPPPPYRGRRGRPLAPSPGAATPPRARHVPIQYPCGGAQNFSSTDCQYTRRHTGHLPRKMSESSAGPGACPRCILHSEARVRQGRVATCGSPRAAPRHACLVSPDSSAHAPPAAITQLEWHSDRASESRQAGPRIALRLACSLPCRVHTTTFDSESSRWLAGFTARRAGCP